MNFDWAVAPDQPSLEALPPTEEEAPLPVIETFPDYPPGVERIERARPKTRAARSPAQATPRKKKRQVPPDWEAKKRMLLLCLLLLIANICVGAYLVLTWGERSKRPPTPAPVQSPAPQKTNPVIVPPPSQSGDLG